MEANVNLEGTVELDTEEVWSELESNVEQTVESYVDNYDFSYVVGDLVRDELYSYDFTDNRYFDRAVHDEVESVVEGNWESYLSRVAEELTDRVVDEVVNRLLVKLTAPDQALSTADGYNQAVRDLHALNEAAQAEARAEDEQDTRTFLAGS